MPRTRGPVHRPFAAFRECRPSTASCGSSWRCGGGSSSSTTPAARTSDAGRDALDRPAARPPVEKEPWTVRWIEENLRDGDVFWDVGANVGTTHSWRRRSTGARVVAVEPGTRTTQRSARTSSSTASPIRSSRCRSRSRESTRVGTLSLADVEPGAAVHELDAVARVRREQSVLVHAPRRSRRALRRSRRRRCSRWTSTGAEPAVLAGAPGRARAILGLRSVILEVEEENTERVVRALDAGRASARRAGRPPRRRAVAGRLVRDFPAPSTPDGSTILRPSWTAVPAGVHARLRGFRILFFLSAINYDRVFEGFLRELLASRP